MSSKRKALSLCVVLMLMSACAVQAAPVSWSYELSQSGDLYTYTFHFENTGNVKDGVFKIHIDGGAVPREWVTSSWSLPDGWAGDRADGYLDFNTGNGSTPADGYYRLFGMPGAPAPTMGWTSADFVWTFSPNGGPTPTSTFFHPNDVKVHVQPLKVDWTNDGPSYWVNPVPVPEPNGLCGLLSGLVGLAGLLRRRIG